MTSSYSKAHPFNVALIENTYTINTQQCSFLRSYFFQPTESSLLQILSAFENRVDNQPSSWPTLYWDRKEGKGRETSLIFGELGSWEGPPCFSPLETPSLHPIPQKNLSDAFPKHFESSTLLSPGFLHGFPLKIWGGMDFFPPWTSTEEGSEELCMRKSSLWDAFPPSYFFLPKIECHQIEGGHLWIENQGIENPEIAKDQKGEEGPPREGPSPLFLSLLSLREETPQKTSQEKPYVTPQILKRTDTPHEKEWCRGVEGILEKIKQEEPLQIEKVVLARKTSLTLSSPLHPAQYLKQCKELFFHDASTYFLFQIERGRTFLGASPEPLYERTGNILTTKAIASTLAKGKTPQEEAKVIAHLKTDPKLHREFSHVMKGIENTLSPLLLSGTWEKIDVLSLPTLYHLTCTFKAHIKKGKPESLLLRTLHPTPATGGVPNTQTLKEIHQKESFDRGWYAAPFGWYTSNRSVWQVAIRSLFIEGMSCHLFAGAGIVEGSDPEEEWEELEKKIAMPLSLLSSPSKHSTQ